MRTSTKVIRVGVVVPAGLAGSFVAVIGLGFLPDTGLVLAFLGTLVVSLVLACGRLEGPATRLLYRVTDADITALRVHGLSDDAIFELTVAAALGEAERRLAAGLALLDPAGGQR